MPSKISHSAHEAECMEMASSLFYSLPFEWPEINLMIFAVRARMPIRGSEIFGAEKSELFFKVEV